MTTQQKTQREAVLIFVCWAFAMLTLGCAEDGGRSGQVEQGTQPSPEIVTLPDTREAIVLQDTARREHRAVMQQHLESFQQIVAALAREDYERAQGLTETHLGFFKHRQAMIRQQRGDFPPAYDDLAFAHHDAAEELAQSMSSQDLTVVMPKLDQLLQACVACHLAYRVDEGNGN